MTLQELKDSAGERFKVRQYLGVAFYFAGSETEPDEDTEWSGYENETGRAVMVMVGDDYRHKIDPQDVSIIPEESYCHKCGQIGCTADGLDREEVSQ